MGDGCWSCPPIYVDLVGDWLQVAWVAARWDSAEVIQDQPFWDLPTKHLVGDPMNQPVLPLH